MILFTVYVLAKDSGTQGAPEIWLACCPGAHLCLGKRALIPDLSLVRESEEASGTPTSRKTMRITLQKNVRFMTQHYRGMYTDFKVPTFRSMVPNLFPSMAQANI